MAAHVIRPGYFRPSRDYPQDWANQRAAWEKSVDCALSPVLNTLLPSSVSPLPVLSTVPLEIVKGRWPETELFPNKKMLELAKEI